MTPPAASRATDDAPSAADVLRVAGHRLVERMAGYLEGVADGRVTTACPPAELRRRFAEPLPRAGRPEEEVWEEAWSRVAADSIHLAHPMFQGHQVAPPLPHAVLADALASLLNNSLAVREMSPAATFVEAEVVRWMVELLGYPATADGTLVSGGSAANLTALLAAREAVFPGAWRRGAAAVPGADRAVVLVSAHAHYSVERAVGVMGLGADAAVAVPVRDGAMDVAALERALADVRAAGRLPLAVVATAGTTGTGRIDPLEAIADVAARQGVWLHVDGAHGASLLCSPALRGRLRGIERADSVAWDPHKLMFMPISLGAVLVRDRRHLDAAFQQSAPYLFHLRDGGERSPDTGKRTLQCSRRFDALKLWICLRHYGVDHFAALQERVVANAEALHAKLAAAPDFEPLHRPDSGILCFRHLPRGAAGLDAGAVDDLQREVRERYNDSGRGWITTTELEGRMVLRVTLINPRTGAGHLDALLAGLREAGEAACAS